MPPVCELGMDFVKNALENIGIVGQLLLLYFLLRGPVRRYYLIFIFFVVEVLGTYADKFVSDRWGRQSIQFHNTYWGTEVFADLVLLVVIITFTYSLMEESPLRAKVRKVLTAVAVGAIVIPLLLFSSYNSTIQLYNFGAALMTFALWTALIAKRTRDPQMLLVCAGLGIAVAGNAALWGMRKYTVGHPDARMVANLLIQIMYLIRLGIWCWAFRPQRKVPVAPAGVTSSVG